MKSQRCRNLTNLAMSVDENDFAGPGGEARSGSQAEGANEVIDGIGRLCYQLAKMAG
jgi:hypothetical protein